MSPEAAKKEYNALDINLMAWNQARLFDWFEIAVISNEVSQAVSDVCSSHGFAVGGRVVPYFEAGLGPDSERLSELRHHAYRTLEDLKTCVNQDILRLVHYWRWLTGQIDELEKELEEEKEDECFADPGAVLALCDCDHCRELRGENTDTNSVTNSVDADPDPDQPLVPD